MSRPLLVFLHGKDSSKETWTAIVEHFEKVFDPNSRGSARSTGETPAVVFAPDLVFHGDHIPKLIAAVSAESPSSEGRPQTNEYELAYELMGRTAMVEQLRRDLQAFDPRIECSESTQGEVSDSEVSRKVILVGHSMGARVASAFSCAYPKTIHSLVLVDMDSRPRPLSLPPSVSFQEQLARLARIPLTFADIEDAIQTLGPFGFDRKRVLHFQATNRIIFESGKLDGGTNVAAARLRTRVHPLVSLLSHQALLNCDWDESFRGAAAKLAKGAVWLFVAAEGRSAVNAEGLQKMLEMMPAVNIVHFPSAGHSIHSDARNAFVDILETIHRSF